MIRIKHGSMVAFLAALAVMTAGVGFAVFGFGHDEAVRRPVLLLSCVPLLVVFFWSETMGTLVRRRRFRRLTDLDDRALYSFYRDQGFPKELVCGLRDDLARAFGLPPAKLHPDHKFVGGPFDRPGLDIVDDLHESVGAAMTDSAERIGGCPDVELIDSVDAYIRAFCRYAQGFHSNDEHESP